MRHVLPLLLLVLLLPLVCLSGCAKYEFELTRPENFRTHVGGKEDALVKADPLEYRMVSYEGHLIMRIYNPTNEAIRLVGEQSVAVDPSGQAHPFPSQTIAPESFIKLILPPPPATLERVGPSVGFGAGYTGTYYRRHEYGYSQYYYDEPRYYAVNEPANPYLWEWGGESDARITLVYERAGKTFRDEFVFRRVKV